MDSRVRNGAPHVLQPVGMYSETESLIQDLEGLHLRNSSTIPDRQNFNESTPSCSNNNGVLSQELRVLGFIGTDSPILDNIKEEGLVLNSYGFNNGDHLIPISPSSNQDPRVGNFGSLQRPYVMETNPFLDHNVSQIPVSNYGSFSPRSNGASTFQNNETGLHYSSIEQNLSRGYSSRDVRYDDGEGDCIRRYPSLLSKNYNKGADSTWQTPFLVSLSRNTINFNGEGSSNYPSLLMEGSHYPRALSYDRNSEFMENTSSGVTASLFELMTDKYRKHLFGELLNDSDYVQKEVIVNAVTRDATGLIEVAKDQHGINSVKDLITTVKTTPKLCRCVTSALNTGILSLMIHPIGYRVVSHCFEHVKHEHCWFLFEAALSSIDILARDEKGSASLNHCIKNFRAPHRDMILRKIIENSATLARHHIGNFVIQSVLDLHDPAVTEMICFHLKDHLKDLSMNHFGSYVMQKCLTSFAGEQLLWVLVTMDNDELEEIAQDPCGNYVLQTALKVKKHRRLHDQLVHIIGQFPMELRFDKYARNVLNCI